MIIQTLTEHLNNSIAFLNKQHNTRKNWDKEKGHILKFTSSSKKHRTSPVNLTENELFRFFLFSES